MEYKIHIKRHPFKRNNMYVSATGTPTGTKLPKTLNREVLDKRGIHYRIFGVAQNGSGELTELIASAEKWIVKQHSKQKITLPSVIQETTHPMDVLRTTVDACLTRYMEERTIHLLKKLITISK